MPEPNATPAPLTMWVVVDAPGHTYQAKSEKVARALAEEWNHTLPCDAPHRAICMVDSAELAATRAKLAEAEAQRGADQRASVVSANAKHEMWQEAIDQRDRNADLVDALNVALAAAESRVAALTEACTLGNRRLGYWCDLHGSLPEDRAALSAMQAALSPSQDAKPQSATWPYVLAFAHAMEAKLAANRHKGDREGWLAMPVGGLLARVHDEYEELTRAAAVAVPYPTDANIQWVLDEAADVANFAMMVADKVASQDAKGGA